MAMEAHVYRWGQETSSYFVASARGMLDRRDTTFRAIYSQVESHIAQVAIKVQCTNIQDSNSVNILNCMDSVPEVFRHLGIFHECLKRTNFPNDVAIAVDINWHEGLMPASDLPGNHASRNLQANKF